MEAVNIQIREAGTASKRIPSTTAGLSSGYQRTNITTTGTSVIETTGGYMLPEIMQFPSYKPLYFQKLCIEVPADLEAAINEKLKEGYRSMTQENNRLAEDSFSVGLEVWPAWEE